MDLQDFYSFVYNELSDDPTNNRANRILDSSDRLCEFYEEVGYDEALNDVLNLMDSFNSKEEFIKILKSMKKEAE